jgi:Kef-type K+ transport system membrane component KefB
MVKNWVSTGLESAWDLLRAGLLIVLVTVLLPFWLVLALAFTAIAAPILAVAVWVAAVIAILSTVVDGWEERDGLSNPPQHTL